MWRMLLPCLAIASVTRASTPGRSRVSMTRVTANIASLRRAHSTRISRSGWYSRFCTLGQSTECTDTPRPRVTKPMISSPGSGLQQPAKKASMSSSPLTISFAWSRGITLLTARRRRPGSWSRCRSRSGGSTARSTGLTDPRPKPSRLNSSSMPE